MHFASLVLSLCLHVAVILLVLYLPAPSLPKLDAPPIMISLVEGAPGGQKAPSPILGHTGEKTDGKLAPTPPAPQSDIAAREKHIAPEPKRETALAEPVEKTPEPVPEKKQELVKIQEKKPEPPKMEKAEIVKKELPPVEKKKTEEPKPEKKEESKKELTKKEEKKPLPKKPQKVDPVAAALAQARKASSRVSSAEKGSAVEQALAQARKSAGGTGGGGGGEGDGPGGGGLGDVYIGEVMLAVRPNWGFASSARKSLACIVKVNVDMTGKVLDARISQSSGNAQFDASAVNSVIRTSEAGDFPPPPNPQYTDLDLVFTLDELRGR